MSSPNSKISSIPQNKLVGLEGFEKKIGESARLRGASEAKIDRKRNQLSFTLGVIGLLVAAGGIYLLATTGATSFATSWSGYTGIGLPLIAIGSALTIVYFFRRARKQQGAEETRHNQLQQVPINFKDIYEEMVRSENQDRIGTTLRSWDSKERIYFFQHIIGQETLNVDIVLEAIASFSLGEFPPTEDIINCLFHPSIDRAGITKLVDDYQEPLNQLAEYKDRLTDDVIRVLAEREGPIPVLEWLDADHARANNQEAVRELLEAAAPAFTAEHEALIARYPEILKLQPDLTADEPTTDTDVAASAATEAEDPAQIASRLNAIITELTKTYMKGKMGDIGALKLLATQPERVVDLLKKVGSDELRLKIFTEMWDFVGETETRGSVRKFTEWKTGLFSTNPAKSLLAFMKKNRTGQPSQLERILDEEIRAHR